MAKTPDQFYQTYNGKRIDDDGAYGVQCVDAFRVFCKWALGYAYPTGTGRADGYWYQRRQHADQFTEVNRSQLKDGDWVFWKVGSRSHPGSHVAMYYHGQEFGQNQGGNRGFCLKATTFSDALGGLRWKGWQTVKQSSKPSKPSKPATSAKVKAVKATGIAKSFSKRIARTYTTTANLNVRNGASTKERSLGVVPKGTKFQCYGYYTGDFYYGVCTANGVTYTGFAHKAYLR